MGIKKQLRLKPKSIDAKGADRIDYVDAEQGRVVVWIQIVLGG